MYFQVPNLLTFFRLCLVPVFFWFFLNESTLAWFIFLLAALSDFIDGWLARRLGQITSFGQVFDPLVDRVLIVVTLLALAYSELISWVAFLLILGRDVIIILGYLILWHEGAKVKVSGFGRVTTFVLLGSLFLLIIKLSFAPYVFWLGVILYLLSGALYVAQGTLRIWRKKVALEVGKR